MGNRGEGWVVLQLVLFLVILLAPQWEPFPVAWEVRMLGLAPIVVGGLLGTFGVLGLGRNLTPFPKPKEGGYLVTNGAYRVVRHPIYSGLILGSFGWALLNASLLGVGLALGLLLFFDLKSRREERWLAEAYPGYPEYQRRVKKLIPWVY